MSTFKKETHHTARQSSRSVFVSFAFRNTSLEALALFSSGESEKKDISSDLKMPTTPRVTTN